MLRPLLPLAAIFALVLAAAGALLYWPDRDLRQAAVESSTEAEEGEPSSALPAPAPAPGSTAQPAAPPAGGEASVPAQDAIAAAEAGSAAEESAMRAPGEIAALPATQTEPAPPAPAAPVPPVSADPSQAGAPGGDTAIAVAPSFDIVRVEPTGDAVLAGRAAPGSELEILSGGEVIATATANSDGEFVAIPEAPLPPGSHDLSVRVAGTPGPMNPEQRAAVIVPEGIGPGPALPQREQLIAAAPPTTDPAAEPAPAPAAPVPPISADPSRPEAPGGDTAIAVAPSFDIVRVEPTGDAVLAGRAGPGSELEILSGGEVIATARANSDGEFVAIPEGPLSPGSHDLSVRVAGAPGPINPEQRAGVIVPGGIETMPAVPEPEQLVAAAPQTADRAAEPAPAPGSSGASAPTGAADSAAGAPDPALRGTPTDLAEPQRDLATRDGPTATPATQQPDGAALPAAPVESPDGAAPPPAQTDATGRMSAGSPFAAGLPDVEYAPQPPSFETPRRQRAGSTEIAAAPQPPGVEADGQGTPAQESAPPNAPVPPTTPETRAPEIGGGDLAAAPSGRGIDSETAPPAEAGEGLPDVRDAPVLPNLADAGPAESRAAAAEGAQPPIRDANGVGEPGAASRREREIAGLRDSPEPPPEIGSFPAGLPNAQRAPTTLPSPSPGPGAGTTASDGRLPERTDVTTAPADGPGTPDGLPDLRYEPAPPNFEVTEAPALQQRQAAEPAPSPGPAEPEIAVTASPEANGEPPPQIAGLSVSAAEAGAADALAVLPEAAAPAPLEIAGLSVRAAEPTESGAAALPEVTAGSPLGIAELSVRAAAPDSPGHSVALPKTALQLGEPVAGLSIQAAEVESDTLYVAGEAAPGTVLRVYADEELVGEVEAGSEGAWLLEAQKDVPVGNVVIRADAVAAGSEVATAQIEMPFTRFPDGVALEPVAAAAEGGGEAAVATGLTPQPAFIIIRRGDNLWRISKRNYGRGIRYKSIFAANRDRIRNPDLIYPGQVFIVPTRDRGWESDRHLKRHQ